MSEMALTAEHFIVIGRGRLIADVSATELAAMSSEQRVYVRTPERVAPAPDARRRRCRGARTSTTHPTDSTSPASTATRSAAVPPRPALVLFELTPITGSLESTFMELTQDTVQYHATTDTTSPDTVPPERQPDMTTATTSFQPRSR